MGKAYIYHDSQDTFYREPFGAVSVGSKVSLRLECKRVWRSFYRGNKV